MKKNKKRIWIRIIAFCMSLVEYRMKWYGEDEQTAMSKLPKMEELVSSENE